MLDITILDWMRAKEDGINYVNLEHMRDRVNHAFEQGYLEFGTSTRGIVEEFANLVSLEEEMKSQVDVMNKL